MHQNTTTDLAFEALPLQDVLQRALQDSGFSHCTPIQKETLPLLLAGRDIAGQSQTGTGKTAAFLLATLHHLLNARSDSTYNSIGPGAIIISPTRELAIQIYNDAVKLNSHAGLRIGLVYGGVDYDKQRKMLEQGVDILIGTPGRLIDYFKQKVYRLTDIRIMVLDEADRMFDLGFINDVRFLLRRMPEPQKRISMLFSATLSWRVTELAYEHMNNPQLIRINPEQITADKVQQTGFHVAKEEKISLLLGLLHRIDPHRTLVFVNTKRTADLVWGYLEGNGFHAALLTGDVQQKKRQNLFQEFASGKLPILVATDLASRGLHIPDISHVINFDMPQNAEDYVHRIGRTARAGASGDAVSLICEEYVYSLAEIEAYIGHKIPTQFATQDMLFNPKPPVRRERKDFVKPRKAKQGPTRSKPARNRAARP
jgi:ATP-dependent RNA helicase RhlB